MESSTIPPLRRVICALVSGALLAAAGALTLPPATLAATPRVRQATAWLQGWPMAGHDPQRTNRSPAVGSVHPLLRVAYQGGCSQSLIGPDGSIYSWCAQGLTAVTALGHHRWTVPLSPIEGSALALAPTGLVLVNANDGRALYRHLFVVALSAATGTTRWAVHALPWSALQGDVPNSKGLVPLVTATGVLYMPFAGPDHTNAGLEAFSPSGQPLRRLLPNAVPAASAEARDGTIYALDSKRLVALTARGITRWTQTTVAMPFNATGALMVGQRGTVYVADGAAVVAYAPDGHRQWRRDLGSQVVTLAERADGVVLAVGAGMVMAITPTGQPMWRHALGRIPSSPLSAPSIVVDARGHAYIGTADGMVRGIAPDGMVTWVQRVGGPTPSGAAPSVALGPDGMLVVAGTDGRLRVYQ